ncbi:MAG: methyltransferase domain-containing protein [Sphingomonadales bacterium]|nr:methyltransferase domain-containing protein [Sphingomonadales bacterium]
MTATPACRHCKAPLTRTLVDLGLSPLANSYVMPDHAHIECPRYPLHARVCDKCLLVQVEDAVPAASIFSSEYAYFSSFSDSWLRHCERYADQMIRRFGLGPQSLVAEIASNDGYLLQYFVARKIPVLGIEPTANTAAVAEGRGVPTLVEFFSTALAERLVSEGVRPDLICSANVLAHVPDINDFVRGLSILLSGDAVYTVEFPHLKNLIEQVQFDTIYHEHYTYLSLVFLKRIFASFGMRVFDVEALQTHGGSLRVYACLEKARHETTPAVADMIAQESAAGMDRPEGYDGFTARVEQVRKDLIAFLGQARAEGKTVAAYGAAAKGNTLLNYCGVGSGDIAYCVDRNPAKQDTLLPGSHIPVFDVERLRTERPDYVLILPWNLRTEIASQLADIKALGTKFVTPVPQIDIF